MKKVIIFVIIFSLLLILGFLLNLAYCSESYKEKVRIEKELEFLREAEPLLEAKKTGVVESLGFNLVGEVAEISGNVITIAGGNGSLKVKVTDKTSIYLVTPRSEGITERNLIKLEEIKLGDQIYAYCNLKELPRENEVFEAANLIITRSK